MAADLAGAMLLRDAAVSQNAPRHAATASRLERSDSKLRSLAGRGATCQNRRPTRRT